MIKGQCDIENFRRFSSAFHTFWKPVIFAAFKISVLSRKSLFLLSSIENQLRIEIE